MKNAAGRKSTPKPEVIESGFNAANAVAASQATSEFAHALQQIAELYGDGQDYDRTRVVHETRMFMASSAEAMLEAGKRLVVIRQNELHGEFIAIVESQLGLNKRTAQVMMQAAVRYLSPALSMKRQTAEVLALGKSKLIELLVEPDEAIADLADGGAVAGLKIDDMRAMTTHELRKALQEARQDKAAKDKVIRRLSDETNALKEAEARRNGAGMAEREQQQLEDVRELGLAAEMAVRKLIAGCAAVRDQPASDAANAAARHSVEFVAQVMAGLISERGLPIDFEDMVTPHWLANISMTKSPTGGASET